MKDYFPFTFNNFTCTAPAKNFTNPVYIGAFDESNLIWFLSLGAVAVILLVVALYFMLASGSGPKYFNPNTPADPYVARQLSPRNMNVPQTRQPEQYDDVPIARRNSYMNQQGSMAPAQNMPMTPRSMQNAGYQGNPNDMYYDRS